MHLTFKRLAGSQYVSRVTRKDGVVFDVKGVGHMFHIPHDLAHYAVERALLLHNGFWGTVAAGGIFPSMMYVEGRRKPHAEERSSTLVRKNAACLNEAELLVRIFNTACEQEQSDDQLRVTLKGRRIPPEHPTKTVTDSQITAVRCAWSSSARRWSSLQPGGLLQLNWPEPR